jgi:hypothetical protein
VRERAERLLPGWTVRIVGLAGLVGLAVTLAGFAVAGPAFAEMRQGELRAHEMEDSYAPDTAPLGHVLLGGLPFLLLLLCLGCAALQIVHFSAVDSQARQPVLIEGELRTSLRSRLPRVLAVYAPLPSASHRAAAPTRRSGLGGSSVTCPHGSGG